MSDVIEYTFVLKDKGTHNQGWWLKLSSIEQLCDYLEKTNGRRYGKVLENYMRGNEWDNTPKEHMPHMDAEALTRAIVMNSSNKNLTIIEGISDFSANIALNQLNKIQDTGCIYINRVGGYHGSYEGEPSYDFIKRKELIFPNFKKDEIRIKQFDCGMHYYAFIDNVQVRDGDTLKWNTYDEAYKQALQYSDE